MSPIKNLVIKHFFNKKKTKIFDKNKWKFSEEMTSSFDHLILLNLLLFLYTKKIQILILIKKILIK